MALPKIELPLFELTVPSTETTVKFRPFTVKEEKALLIAQQSKDIDQIILAIKQLINNCVYDVDVEKMPMFDLEYLMMQLRAKSVNNLVEFTITDPDTKEKVPLVLNVEDVTLKRHNEHDTKIVLNDDYFIIMRYPTINELRHLSNLQKNDPEVIFNIMVSCIDLLCTTDGENIYKMSDFSQSEVIEFVNGLTTASIEGLKKFFETMPVLRVELPYKLKDGTEKTFVLEGLDTFFT